MSRDCPHEGVLLPLLLCLLIDDLIARLSRGGVHTRGEADFFFGQWGISQTRCRAHVVGPANLQTRCSEIGLSVNFDKIELVFRRRRKLPGFFEPLFFGVTFEYFYLGKVSRGSPGFSSDLERHVNTKLKKDHILL